MTWENSLARYTILYVHNIGIKYIYVTFSKSHKLYLHVVLDEFRPN